jgi:hypothetical protein
MRSGARAKEGSLDRLIHTPSLGWFLKTLLAPRFVSFAFRRRREFFRVVRQKLAATG